MSKLQALSDEAQHVVSARISDFMRTAKQDWPEMLGIAADVSLDQLITAFDKYHDRSAIQKVVIDKNPIQLIKITMT